MVSTLVDPGDSNHALKFNHTGGPIGMSIVVVSSQACGSLTYKLYPGHGPAFRDDELSYDNRYTHELAVGNEAGEISALYKRPEITNPNFPDKVGVDDLVAKGTYIRIN